MRWRQRDGIEWLEAELPGALAVFSTRRGGVSEDGYASLNLGVLTGDDRDRVAENRRRLSASLQLPAERVRMGLQVHGAVLARHSAAARNRFADPGGGLPEADGHLTGEPGLALLVLVADCLPVALSGREGVAMLHCGWRGLAAGIIRAAVEALGGGPGVRAAVGPGIGACCYEVGEEVLVEFARLGPDVVTGRRLDLAAVARRQLEEAGVEGVDVAGLCTACERERFFSHRRDGEGTGRQAGLVWRS